ncbi:hypothetical protein Ddye_021848 [Dipteronia dyeriana]|uniref:Retrotransposon gag domain-containing protein n=1 Tax=Dipteronia dyeriana TaxID=168575 RepID=A0AAD9WXX5_9ROSI|nr:hypothetical protein Ddye_021848 [Dipteronia dyeriana]
MKADFNSTVTPFPINMLECKQWETHECFVASSGGVVPPMSDNVPILLVLLFTLLNCCLMFATAHLSLQSINGCRNSISSLRRLAINNECSWLLFTWKELPSNGIDGLVSSEDHYPGKNLQKQYFIDSRPTDYEVPSEALTRLKQGSSIADYQAEFEKLSERIDELPEKFLVGCFIVGLRDEIHLDVKVKQPRTLSDAIGVARLIEERNTLHWKADHSAQTPAIAPSPTPRNSSPGILGPPPSNKTNQPSPFSFRRITNQEARERREKGLSYYCDEKFLPGHHCQKPQLFMIEDIHLPPDDHHLNENAGFHPCGQ